MAFDESTVMTVLNGEGTNEEKVKKLFSEYDAEKTSLTSSKEKILSEKKELQRKYEELSGKIEPEISEYKTRIQELEEQVKKGGAEEAKAAWEAQRKRDHEAASAELAKANAKADDMMKLHTALLERRRKDLVFLAVEKAMDKCGVTIPEDREGLRKSFLYDHESEFTPGENDDIPVNKDYKTVHEVMGAFISTPGGQRFLPNRNTGGGAPGAGAPTRPQTGNPFSKDSFNLSEQARITKENPTRAAELMAAAGVPAKAGT